MKRSLTRIIASTTAVIGIAAGSLALATPSMAITTTAPRPAVAVAVAYNNLGLTRTQAMGVQCFLGVGADGYLGTESWKEMQRFLNRVWDQSLGVDGIVGPNTIRGLQYFLKYGNWGYTGALDGIAGPGTQAAFARFGTQNYNQFC
ncbi:MAG TPA: peptidoglycan-binding protein [Streptomyces sp.]|uniref:peptidoglycan-binding protein n=1 Tax=Streptomyces sp. TaxID=1931 RepID=UPI002CE7C2D9|nr:peptidoglycan-binding protein [Streptomyces sp.]HWU06982.1 peptidoglycan-binding protein [Streptomyces sp.]